MSTAHGTISGSQTGEHSGRIANHPQAVRRLELLCALALTAFIVFLHVHRAMQAGGLWRDEVTTLATATLPSLSDVWASQIYARPPLLPYGVVRMWAGINGS